MHPATHLLLMNFCRYFRAPLPLFGLCLVITACEHPAPDTPQMPMLPSRPVMESSNRSVVAPGDTLEVFVKEDEKFNGRYNVRENGDIILRQLGRVHVGGLTVPGAQEMLRKTLQSSQLANPSVIVDRVGTISTQTYEERAKMLIFVTGAVRSPGQHVIALTSSQPILAYEALLIAGGTTPFADETHAYILRRGNGTMRTNIPLNLRNIRQGVGPDVPLQEGDLITVPERHFGLSF